MNKKNIIILTVISGLNLILLIGIYVINSKVILVNKENKVVINTHTQDAVGIKVTYNLKFESPLIMNKADRIFDEQLLELYSRVRLTSFVFEHRAYYLKTKPISEIQNQFMAYDTIFSKHMHDLFLEKKSQNIKGIEICSIEFEPIYNEAFKNNRKIFDKMEIALCKSDSLEKAKKLKEDSLKILKKL